MKPYLIALFLIIGIWSCRPISKKDKVYYIYNSKSIFKSSEVIYDTFHFITFEANRYIHIIPEGLNQSDTRLVSYSLWHFSERGKYKDSTFVKHISCLDSIEFYATEWLKKEDKLANFWKTWSGFPDSLKIFLFEPIKGTDSVLFRKVHRYYRTPDD
jgi:hypothetical protein